MSDNNQLKELSIRVAEDIIPLLIFIDTMNAQYSTNELKQIVQEMNSLNSKLDALPFPETMCKAKIGRAQKNTLHAIVNLMEAREIQLEIQRQFNSTPGQEVLKAMGLV